MRLPRMGLMFGVILCLTEVGRTDGASDAVASLDSHLADLRGTPSVYVPKDEIDFSNICNKPRLEGVANWFEEWLAEFYLTKPFANMLVTSTSLIGEIEDHVSTVQKYLATLQGFVAKTGPYAVHFMRTKLYGLVGTYGRHLGMDFTAPPAQDTSLDGTPFNKVVLDTQNNGQSVVKASEVFYEDLKLAAGSADLQAKLPLHETLKPAMPGYLAEVTAINKAMCGVLMNALLMFAGDGRFQSVWEKLSQEEGRIADIAFFFNQFQFSAGEFRPAECGDGKAPGSIRGAISLGFTGHDFDSSLTSKFFSAKLFEWLAKSASFRDLLEHDSLLLVPRTTHHDLARVRQLFQLQVGFSVELANEFPDLDVTVAFEPTPDKIEQVHTANLYLMLYKLYVLLRSDKLRVVKPGMGLRDIYLAMYQWVTTTDFFRLDVMASSAVNDVQLTEAQLASQKLTEGRLTAAGQDLIPVPEYILYFPGLVTLLAKKLDLDVKSQTKEIGRNVDAIPVLFEIAPVRFPKDSIHPEVARLVDANVLKTKLGALAKAIKALKYEETLKACTRQVRVGDAQQPRLVLTFDCVRPFYEEWVRLFTTYFGKLGDKDDITPYVTLVETTVLSLDSKPKQDLLNFCIVMYFQVISQKDAKAVLSYERRAAERFLMKAITLMTADVRAEAVRGFTTFMVGASDYSAFGKYMKFQDSGESEFHGFNIFYVVLFAQMNEAKRLKLANDDKGFKGAMAYKAELQRTFEKRYPGVVKLLSDDAKARPLRFIKTIFKNQFFLHFMDFFDLYYLAPEGKEGKAPKASPLFASEFVSLHSVFINFYHFLYALRGLVKGRVEDPHRWVLERLEDCLGYASRDSAEPVQPALEEYCIFSDRKYAELYYFYKFYLLLEGKAAVTLDAFRPDKLNTHARMFFIYAANIKRFRQALDRICAEEDSRWKDLCVSWVLFRDFHRLILDSTHRGSSFGYVRQFISEKVLPNPNPVSASHVKFNVLFAAEAISLLVEGKGVNYSRFIALFNLDEQYALAAPGDTELGEDDAKVLALFKVKPGDTDNRKLMLQYLKRTYFKKGRSSNEQAITLAIVSVLDESTGAADDLLSTYFKFANHVLVNYVKLFLMYATRDEHYAKIADFLIANGVFFELANLNRPEDDLAYKSILEKLALNDQNYLSEKQTGKATSQFPHDVPLYRKVLFESLAKRYKKILESMSVKLMKMAQVDGEKNLEKSADEFDIFSEFMAMGKQDVEANALAEEQHFEKVNAQLLAAPASWKDNPSMKQVQIWTLQKGEQVEGGAAGTGVTKELMAMKVGDAKALLAKAEALENSLISQEKIDAENFGFSEKVIIRDQVERIVERVHIEGGFIHPDMKTPTIMESLITLGEAVETAKVFLEKEGSTLAVEEKNERRRLAGRKSRRRISV